MAVTHFCRGLTDRDAARLVSVNAYGRVGEAIRIAGAAEVVKSKDKKPAKSKASKNYYMQSNDPPIGDEEEQDEYEGADFEAEAMINSVIPALH